MNSEAGAADNGDSTRSYENCPCKINRGGIILAGMELYVSTFGNDNWSGYLKEPAEDGSDGPFASLERAVIESRKTQGINKRIIIKGGEYYDVSIKLDSSDSGLCIEGAEGETPVLYGGIELNAWNETEDGMWYLKLPEVQGELWDTTCRLPFRTNY